MPFVGDSRSNVGPGYLPLQDHGFKDAGIPLENRTQITGVRTIKERSEYGHFIIDSEAVGDITNCVFWPTDNKDKRALGGWSWAWSSIIPESVGTGGGGNTNVGPITPSGVGGEVPANSRTPSDNPLARYFEEGPITPSTGGGTPGNTPTTGSDGPSSGGMKPQPIKLKEREHGDTPKVLPTRNDTWGEDSRFKAVEAPEPGKGGSATVLPGGPDDPLWQSIPKGTYGITVAHTNEDKQVIAFHPTDPRLTAVHRGEPDYSTYVHEVDGKTISRKLRAPLHAAFKVTEKPTGKLSLNGNTSNTLAWNIGLSGKKDVVGGLVADDGSAKSRFGHVSVRCGGPLDIGTDKCKHNIGKTADGATINATHLSHLSFIRRDDKYDGPIDFETHYPYPSDAPYIVKAHWGYDTRRAYNWGGNPGELQASGMWRLWSTCYFTSFPGGGTPTDDREPRDPPPPEEPGGPTTPGGDNEGPTTPSGGGSPPPSDGGGPGSPGGDNSGGPSTPDGDGGKGPTTPITDGPLEGPFWDFFYDRYPKDPDDLWPPLPTPDDAWGLSRTGTQRLLAKDYIGDEVRYANMKVAVGASDYDKTARPAVITGIESSFPSITFRAYQVIDKELDQKHNIHPTSTQSNTYVAKAPTTLRMEGYAAQGSTSGIGAYTTSVVKDGYTYTQRPNASSASGGTASGGIVYTNPEVSLADVDKSFAPTGITKSTSHIVVTEGVRIVFGSPNLSNGGANSGVSLENDFSDESLIIRTHSNAGSTSDVMKVRSDGALLFGNASNGNTLSTNANKLFVKDKDNNNFSTVKASTFELETKQTYTLENETTPTRTLDPTTATTADVSNVLATLLKDLETAGFLTTS